MASATVPPITELTEEHWQAVEAWLDRPNLWPTPPPRKILGQDRGASLPDPVFRTSDQIDQAFGAELAALVAAQLPGLTVLSPPEVRLLLAWCWLRRLPSPEGEPLPRLDSSAWGRLVRIEYQANRPDRGATPDAERGLALDIVIAWALGWRPMPPPTRTQWQRLVRRYQQAGHTRLRWLPDAFVAAGSPATWAVPAAVPAAVRQSTEQLVGKPPRELAGLDPTVRAIMALLLHPVPGHPELATTSTKALLAADAGMSQPRPLFDVGWAGLLDATEAFSPTDFNAVGGRLAAAYATYPEVCRETWTRLQQPLNLLTTLTLASLDATLDHMERYLPGALSFDVHAALMAGTHWQWVSRETDWSGLHYNTRYVLAMDIAADATIRARSWQHQVQRLAYWEPTYTEGKDRVVEVRLRAAAAQLVRGGAQGQAETERPDADAGLASSQQRRGPGIGSFVQTSLFEELVRGTDGSLSYQRAESSVCLGTDCAGPLRRAKLLALPERPDDIRRFRSRNRRTRNRLTTDWKWLHLQEVKDYMVRVQRSEQPQPAGIEGAGSATEPGQTIAIERGQPIFWGDRCGYCNRTRPPHALYHVPRYRLFLQANRETDRPAPPAGEIRERWCCRICGNLYPIKHAPAADRLVCPICRDDLSQNADLTRLLGEGDLCPLCLHDLHAYPAFAADLAEGELTLGHTAGKTSVWVFGLHSGPAGVPHARDDSDDEFDLDQLSEADCGEEIDQSALVDVATPDLEAILTDITYIRVSISNGVRPPTERINSFRGRLGRIAHAASPEPDETNQPKPSGAGDDWVESVVPARDTRRQDRFEKLIATINDTSVVDLRAALSGAKRRGRPPNHRLVPHDFWSYLNEIEAQIIAELDAREP